MGQLLNLPDSLFRETQRRHSHTDIVRSWIILSISCVIFMVTYLAMAAGNESIAPQLFYFPILYATYFYPSRGVIVAMGCAIAYAIAGSFFVSLDLLSAGFVVGQALLFICIAAAFAYFMKTRAADTPVLPSEPEEIQRLIERGENDRVEFKRETLWSSDLTPPEINASESTEIRKYKHNTSRFIIARSIAGFLNTEGGDLIIGIREDRIQNKIDVVGIENEYHKLHETDRNPDGYRRMIIDAVIRKFLPEIFNVASMFIHISFPSIAGKTVCRVHVTPFEKPVFVNIGNEELFFIRVDASTRPLTGKPLTKYILSRFSPR
jgi:hypothetical protein